MAAKNSWRTDPKLQNIVYKVRLHQGSYKHYTFDGTILRRKGKVVIGIDQNIKRRILHHFHNTMMGEHSGDDLTYRRIKDQFYWKGLQKEVKKWVQECITCQKNKPLLQMSAGLLQPLSIPDRAWKSISVDFIVSLPKSIGMTVIFVVCDRFTKYAHFTPLAAKVGQVFLDTVVKLHGCPSKIISERDSIFISAFWTELMKQHEVKLLRSTAFHPQTNGQTEALNKALEGYLRCVTGDLPKKWTKHLSSTELWYNTKFHTTTKMSRFEALYGYPPSMPNVAMQDDSLVKVVAYTMRTREQIAKLLQDNLHKVET
uniref:Retrotransposable element Tf2 n=1 Tax=Cajanus cajan TaxID=3821 RepID=A0A151U638_CAJCA|nr:Retrotransposable element Tf2 [Cajanus cajan]